MSHLKITPIRVYKIVRHRLADTSGFYEKNGSSFLLSFL